MYFKYCRICFSDFLQCLVMKLLQLLLCIVRCLVISLHLSLDVGYFFTLND